MLIMCVESCRIQQKIFLKTLKKVLTILCIVLYNNNQKGGKQYAKENFYNIQKKKRADFFRKSRQMAN